MKTETRELSRAAASKVADLAIEAAKSDNWMRPIVDESDEEDFGQFVMEHRGLWEQTDHFQLAFNDQIIAITEADAESQGVFRIDDGETWLHAFQVPAREAFWDAWEEEVKLYDLWEKEKG